MKEIKDKVSDIHRGLKEVRDEMYEMEERLNMSMIRQFQLHQNEMRAMLEGMLSRER